LPGKSRCLRATFISLARAHVAELEHYGDEEKFSHFVLIRAARIAGLVAAFYSRALFARDLKATLSRS
jgi:hypothetical protein